MNTIKVESPVRRVSKSSPQLDELFAALRKTRDERRAAVAVARPALDRLCRKVLTQRSGQCYKVRALLYSLYNGQATSLIEILCLDWDIRMDLCAVFLAFGFEENRHEPGMEGEEERPSFFYAEMKSAIVAVGQWDWFVEAHQAESEVGT